MSSVWRLLRALKLRVLGPEKLPVGVDHLGNKYYRIPKHETWAGHIIQERRFVEAVNIKEHEYEVGDIPTEWEGSRGDPGNYRPVSLTSIPAWIRKRRKEPPTVEEILKNENNREAVKKKVEEVYEKDRLLQAKEYEEGLVATPVQTQIKGHASAQHYGRNEPSEDPVSTANTFQPGSWKPPQDQEHKK
ncbi:NADH dehydrogenase [ubiquinone] 1 alpha subcomplex assembly factor 2 isoform X1 [Eublepharis macularius]|uniref:NADH dehydrogenase [ubiquinone] 1 alpha subcomplex assembly factor 2 isoform X1 n=1 Tax=Eublepharis macularius TaxID=481883 RepID=A0AA97JUY9_EUBMA|nr:NADH dehydrogenase [ubiquinone] 1 alpha subcomplex assembly factor 2 isoform X1 [Eublepharis macularius]